MSQTPKGAFDWPNKLIGTARFGCGCTVHTDPDVNGITPWLEHCPLHAAAPTLLAACKYALSQLRAAGIVCGDVAAAIAQADPT